MVNKVITVKLQPNESITLTTTLNAEKYITYKGNGALGDYLKDYVTKEMEQLVAKNDSTEHRITLSACVMNLSYDVVHTFEHIFAYSNKDRLYCYDLDY